MEKLKGSDKLVQLKINTFDLALYTQRLELKIQTIDAAIWEFAVRELGEQECLSKTQE